MLNEPTAHQTMVCGKGAVNTTMEAQKFMQGDEHSFSDTFWHCICTVLQLCAKHLYQIHNSLAAT